MRNEPINDGGPAFPLNDPLKSTGMTLRDYFAAKAMTQVVWYDEWSDDFSGSATTAYNIADAMLKAREAK